tara:strand:+ start:388 stop:672 length:285 start_codon:yes stop_codon:yes gene_type:complete
MDVPQALVMVEQRCLEMAVVVAEQQVMEEILAQEQVREVMVVLDTLAALQVLQSSSVAVAVAVPRMERLLHQVMVKAAVAVAVNRVPMVLERMV